MSMLRLPLYAPQGPSVARAGALSGATTVNLLVIGALLLPAVVDVPLRQPRAEPPPLLVTRVVEVAAAAVAPAPVEPRPPQPRAPAARPLPVPPPATDPIVSEQTSTPPPSPPSTLDPSATQASAPAAAGEATLAYIVAPQPTYPVVALRKGWEGVVLLRVRVGADGVPLAVEIARSSGHAVLDAAARRQVMARWRFQPALREGVAVEAIGLVPLAFRLDRG